MITKMDPRFSPHNTHLYGVETFKRQDPHLRRLADQPLVHRSELLDRLPRGEPGIYTLSGGRQVGKSTLLKQWMSELLGAGTHPSCVAFLTGELIDDHHALVQIVSEFLRANPLKTPFYLVLDEVTYIHGWDKGVKFLADSGALDGVVLVVTGSDQAFIRDAVMRFPGRRGDSRTVDFHLTPLTFLETVRLKHTFTADDLAHLAEDSADVDEAQISMLFAAFEDYLVHGGFLTAINDVFAKGRVQEATLSTYSDWIRGDVLKRGRSEHYLREVLSAIVKRLGCPVTWNALSSDLSIDHPKTVGDYMALLESMDVILIQAALVEHALAPAPKKARKLAFCDPLIFHAVRQWLSPVQSPYEEVIVPACQDPEWSSKLAECCAVEHFARYFPTYYIKAEGEVDIAYVADGRFWPVEVKWTGQLRVKDLKQVAKYPNGKVLDRSHRPRTDTWPVSEPLPLALIRLASLGARQD